MDYIVFLGRTRVTPVYLNLLVKSDDNSASGVQLIYRDLLIFPTGSNSLGFQVHKTTDFSISLRLRPPPQHHQKGLLNRISITVRDCFRVQTVHVLMDGSQEVIDKMMLDGVSLNSSVSLQDWAQKTAHGERTSRPLIERIFTSKEPQHIPYQVILVCATIASVVILLLLIGTCYLKRLNRNKRGGIIFKSLFLKDPTNLKFFILSGEKAHRKDNGYLPLSSKSPKNRRKPQTNSATFSCTTKALLAFYISFHVLYTFIFTFSVALSVLLSVWPPSVFEGSVENVYEQSLHLGIQREALEREASTDKALNQQSRKATQMIHACQDLVIRQIIEVANELNRIVSEVLDMELQPRNNTDNVFSALGVFFGRQLSDLNPSIQDYVAQLRSELDNTMMPDIVRFSEFLTNVFGSQWLMFARRLMNTTQNTWNFNAPEVNFAPQPEHLKALRLNMTKIHFAQLFGLMEAEALLLTPTRIGKL